MAEHSDGAIVIDTALNNSGFTSGAQKLRQMVDRLKNTVNSAGKGMASGANAYTKAVNDGTKATREAADEAARLRDRHAEILREMFAIERAGINDSNRARYAELKTELAGVVSRLRELRTEEATTASENSTMADSAERAAEAMGDMGGGGIPSGLKRIASAAGRAAVNLAKMAGRTIIGGLKALGSRVLSLAKSMLRLNRAHGKSSGLMGMSFGNLLKYGLGIRSLFTLFNRLRSMLTEGLKDLAQHDGRLNASLKALKSGLSQVKAALASAFAPIVTAITPALLTLINLLNKAVTAIGMFLAALTGQPYYMAPDAAENAAAGIKSIGAAAHGAAGDAEDLKRQLAGFDQLNVLSKSSGGGGGGGGNPGNGGGWHPVPIDSAIGDFVKRIKELFTSGQFEEIAQIIADGINSALAKVKKFISWDNLGKTISDGIDVITRLFNGLVDKIDWDLLGRTFGAGINTLLNAINQLFTKIDWKNLGKKLVEGLNGLIDEVDWDLLGETVGNRFNLVIDFIGGAIKNFKWKNLGTKLSNGINKFFNTVNWTKIGQNIDAAVSGVLDVILSVVGNFSWGNTGTKFANAFNALFSNPFTWIKVRSAISKTITGLLDFLRNFFATFSWGDAATAFANTLKGIFNPITWAKLSLTFASAINGILSGLKKFVGEFNWGEEGAAFALAVNSLVDKVDWKQIGTTISDTMKGAIDWVTAFLQDLDVEQMAESLKTLLAAIDWAGIGAKLYKLLGVVVDAVFDLLGTAIGDRFFELLRSIFGDKFVDYVIPLGLGFDFTPKSLTDEEVAQMKRDIEAQFDKVDFEAEVPVATKVDEEGVEETFYIIQNALTGEMATIPVKPEISEGDVQKEEEKVRRHFRSATPVGINASLVNSKPGFDWKTIFNLPSVIQQKVQLIKANIAQTVTTLFGLAQTKYTPVQMYKKDPTQTPATLFNTAKPLSFTAQITTKAQTMYDTFKKSWDEKAKALKLGITPPKGVVTVTYKKFLGFDIPIPKYDFKWNAKGGILDGAQLFGMLGNTLLGGGEAGKEAVLPLERNTGWMDTLAEHVWNYHAPSVASGSLMPYEVAAQIAQTGADIQTTMNANSEDIIQTIISVIATQTSALVSAIRSSGSSSAGGASAQDIINEINRRSQMFAASPLRG